MFTKAGWLVVSDIDEADLIQFTGGEDVSPHLYGEYAHDTTRFSSVRDEEEAAVYKYALVNGIPMAGICRGGQFLNVMNGGRMYQDVNNHAIRGTHEAFILGNLVPVQVTSTHHQMMRPNTSPDADCHILMTASLATRLSHASDINSGVLHNITTYRNDAEGPYKHDIESVYYGSTNCLCYQPHPEHRGDDVRECREVYFNFIETYLFDDYKVRNSAISAENSLRMSED